MYISRQIESFQGLFVFLVLVHRTHPPVDSVHFAAAAAASLDYSTYLTLTRNSLKTVSIYVKSGQRPLFSH